MRRQNITNTSLPELASFTPMYANNTPAFRGLSTTKYDPDAEIAILGVPFDAAVSNRPGARMAPRAIRIASSMIEQETTPGWKEAMKKSIIDIGDIRFDYGRPAEIYQQISAFIAPILNNNTATVAIGGDHSISYAFVKAYAEKIGTPISLLQFDSHTDTWSDEGTKRIDHGSMFYHAIKQGLIDPQHSVQLGIRTTNSDPLGVTVIYHNFIHTHGLAKTLKIIRDTIGQRPTYLSFDIDFLDPAFAPGTGTPVCGGFSTWQAEQLLQGLVGINFCGMDLVEVSPPYDVSEVTSLAAAHLISHMIELF